MVRRRSSATGSRANFWARDGDRTAGRRRSGRRTVGHGRGGACVEPDRPDRYGAPRTRARRGRARRVPGPVAVVSASRTTDGTRTVTRGSTARHTDAGSDRTRDAPAATHHARRGRRRTCRDPAAGRRRRGADRHVPVGSGSGCRRAPRRAACDRDDHHLGRPPTTLPVASAESLGRADAQRMVDAVGPTHPRASAEHFAALDDGRAANAVIALAGRRILSCALTA